MYHNRYACDVLEEIRNSIKTLNFGGLPGLVEELQTAFNRMEAALESEKEYIGIADDCKKLAKMRSKLRTQVKALEGVLPEEEKPKEKKYQTLNELYQELRLDDD